MFKQSGKAGAKHTEATIVNIAAGGDAVAREEGKQDTAGRTIFVFGAAPGERVKLKIIEEHPRFARGELLEVLEKSPDRRAPQCTYFGTCGGCDWQHISYETQLKTKQEFIERAFSQTAATIAPIVPSPEQLAYRARTRLHFRREGPHVTLGYFARGSTTIVEIRECPLLQPKLQEALRTIRSQLLADLSGSGTITLLGEDHIAAEFYCDLSVDAQRIAQKIAKKQSQLTLPIGPLGSLSISSPDGQVSQIGADAVPVLREDKPQLSSGKVFSQANPGVNQKLREVVLSLVKESLARRESGTGEDPSTTTNTPRAARVLELYAGAGNMTLPMLQAGAEVLAVEADPEAVKWLRKNTRREFATTCDVRQGEAAAVSKRLAGERFDVIVLDPPRSGAAPTIEVISKLAPAIVYISCDLANLARDVQSLHKKGFSLRKIFSFDMFPQSAHVETVAFLEKTR
jgi:23S rRNA (uracil1939-C5)-methyltransferase